MEQVLQALAERFPDVAFPGIAPAPSKIGDIAKAALTLPSGSR
jgi:hypothetical protein